MSFETIRRINYASAPSCLTPANLARDFDNYHLPLQRLQSRLEHGPGVLGGLEASASVDGLGVVVSPGVALDAQGRLIVLGDDGSGRVGDAATAVHAPVLVPLPPGAAGELVLTVEYAEDTAVAIDAANPTGCKQVEPRPRFRLRPPAEPIADGAVALAAVDVGADGKVAGVRSGSRSFSSTITGALAIRQADPADLSTRQVGVLGPAAGGGLRLDVPGAPLELVADRTVVRGHDANAVALHVAGPLAVSGPVTLGEPGTGAELGPILAGLRQEIDALKQALAAPMLTIIWAHGAEAEAIFEDGAIFSQFKQTSGYEINLKPGASVSYTIRLPSPSLVQGRLARLRRVFLLGFSSNNTSFRDVRFGTSGLGAGSLNYQEDAEVPLPSGFTSITAANTFTLFMPTVTTGLEVTFNATANSNNPAVGYHAVLIAVGAEFVS